MLAQNVLQCDISSLENTQISLSKARPGRYRLIRCRGCAVENVLSVYEFEDLTSTPYAAISYIWKGNRSPPEGVEEAPSPTFTVDGAGDGDPVSIAVLRDACATALLEGVEWIWLDCLCIIQTSKDDKNWQIKRMYDIYCNCRVSIVLPGGLSRLVYVDEETKWITRAWTLQEVVAPPNAVVLLSWTLGAGRWEGWEGAVSGELVEVSPGVSAKISLHQLLNACHYPQALSWTPAQGNFSGDDISPCVLGDYGDAAAGALMWALGATDPEERAMALWQASMLRASSRPVDMVFSIMGAFGVSLELKDFGKQDRLQATIALAQEILRQGGKPVWLGLSLDIRPSPFLSSFADFPVTDVSGSVRWETRSGPVRPNVSDAIYDIESLNEAIEDDDASEGQDASLVFLPQYWLTGMPSGTMDDCGYLTITTKAAFIVPTELVFGRRRTNLNQNNDEIAIREFADAPNDVIRIVGTDGRVWDIVEDVDKRQQQAARDGDGTLPVLAYIVIVGTSKPFPKDRVYQPDPRPIGGILLPEMSTIRACAVEEHRPGKFHRSSTFLLDHSRFTPMIDKWKLLSVAIGGPVELPTLLNRAV